MLQQRLSTLALTLTTLLTATLPAQAGPVNDRVTCYFFRGNSLELKNTCQLKGATWAGGGNLKLHWPDGVVTIRQWQNGPSPLSPTAHSWIDGEDAFVYERDKHTHQRLTPKAARGKPTMACFQTQQHGNSVCWNY